MARTEERVDIDLRSQRTCRAGSLRAPELCPADAGSRSPATAYHARPKAEPGDRSSDHERLRRDRVDVSGKITLRYQSRLYSIGIGRTHVVLVQELNVRIINAATGELLRQLVLDPTHRYQPTGRPPGPTPKTDNP